MGYRHCHVDGSEIDLPVGKVVCVGRNYAAHAKELGNVVPDVPMLFIKPATALVGLDQPLSLPGFSDDVHHEVELAVLIGQPLSNVVATAVAPAIAGLGVAVDLTARDVQAALKQKGHPWEISKGFDGACPLSAFVSRDQFPNLQNIDLSITVSGELRQDGNTRDMVFGVEDLVAYMSTYFTLLPGDLVLTGTPEGVGPVAPGDSLILTLGVHHRFEASIAG